MVFYRSIMNDGRRTKKKSNAIRFCSVGSSYCIDRGPFFCVSWEFSISFPVEKIWKKTFVRTDSMIIEFVFCLD